jgi:hypothetical protein
VWSLRDHLDRLQLFQMLFVVGNYFLFEFA